MARDGSSGVTAAAIYRTGAVVVAVLWLGALIAPVWTTKPDTHNLGWFVAAIGWLGPLGLNIAWYANLLLPVCVVRLARGRAPGRTLSLVMGAIALTGLLPFFINDFELTGRWQADRLEGPGVALWLAAFAINAALGTFCPSMVGKQTV